MFTCMPCVTTLLQTDFEYSLYSRFFPLKMPLGYICEGDFHSLAMIPLSFETNWTLCGIDLTSQTFVVKMGPYEGFTT